MTFNSSRRPSRSARARSACAQLWLALIAIAGCTWQPTARNVEPELVLAGPARVLRLIDGAGRDALIGIGLSAPSALHIVQMDTRQHCELPDGSTVASWVTPLTAPNLHGAQAHTFLLPVFKQDGATLNLYYTDETCTLLGPFGETLDSDLGILQLSSDERNVSLARDSNNTMRLVDPWTDTTTKIADNVTAYASVQRGDGSSAPEALWLIEGGKLTQRALDGTLLLTLGTNVDTTFAQTLSDQLRVAYVDGGDLYEAKGPSFAPVLIAESSCNPLYQNNSLDLWMPCADQQLVRIDLTSGAIRRFEPAVFRSYATADLTFEQAHDVPGDPSDYNLYVADGLTSTASRVQLNPRPASSASEISNKRLVGLSRDGQLGIWTLNGDYTAGYRGVQRLQTFRDQRTEQLLWLMAYAVDPNGIATLGVVEQKQLEAVVASIQLDAGVPGTSDASASAARPQVIAERADIDGYAVFYPSGVDEPVILTLEPPIEADAAVFGGADVFSGALNAYLLSADQSTHVDAPVQSYQVVSAPIPGILYGILQGPRAGLWFAAL